MRPHLIRGAADGCDQKLMRGQHQLRATPSCAACGAACKRRRCRSLSAEGPAHEQYRFGSVDGGFELWVSDDLPLLRLAWTGEQTTFRMDAAQFTNLRYRIEQSRATTGGEPSGRRECSRPK
jgi:hypothetical protein